MINSRAEKKTIGLWYSIVIETLYSIILEQKITIGLWYSLVIKTLYIILSLP